MIKFSVNPENRTVTAYLSEPKVSFNKGFTGNPMVKAAIDKVVAKDSKALDCSEMKGVAKCHPDDEFDAEIGKSVAMKKLLAKYHVKRAKVLKRIANHLDSASLEASELLQAALQNLKDFGEDSLMK